MALKAGSLLTTGNDSVLIERLQTGGPGTLNIPTEKIYELGNYESVATIRDAMLSWGSWNLRWRSPA